MDDEFALCWNNFQVCTVFFSLRKWFYCWQKIWKKIKFNSQFMFANVFIGKYCIRLSKSIWSRRFSRRYAGVWWKTLAGTQNCVSDLQPILSRDVHHKSLPTSNKWVSLFISFSFISEWFCIDWIFFVFSCDLLFKSVLQHQFNTVEFHSFLSSFLDVFFVQKNILNIDLKFKCHFNQLIKTSKMWIWLTLSSLKHRNNRDL